MDVIFDIDGTLADASHRLHFIKDPDFWITPHGNPLLPPRPNWHSFLADDQVAKDEPICQTWAVLCAMLKADHRVLFITGRKESSRPMTLEWLNRAVDWKKDSLGYAMLMTNGFPLYMRGETDRRPSSEVKRDLLKQAMADGFVPILVFEDRKDDTEMWRSEGLLCCQVADGNY